MSQLVPLDDPVTCVECGATLNYGSKQYQRLSDIGEGEKPTKNAPILAITQDDLLRAVEEVIARCYGIAQLEDEQWVTGQLWAWLDYRAKPTEDKA